MFKSLLKCSAFAIAVLVLLYLPILGWAQTTTKEEAKAAKVTPDLLALIANQSNTVAPVNGLQKVDLFQRNGNAIAIEAFTASGQDSQTLLQALQALGLQNGRVYRQTIVGYLPVNKLVELKNINALKLARPSYKPSRNTGSVT